MTNKRKFILITLGGLGIEAVIIALAWLFIVTPLVTAHDTLITSRQELDTLERKYQMIRDIQHTQQEFSPSLDKVSRIFLTSNTIVPFLKTLESVAHRSNVDLSIVSAKLIESSSPSTGSSFSLTAKGTFPNLFTFINLLENAPYDINTSGIALTGGKDAPTSLTMQIVVLTSK